MLILNFIEYKILRPLTSNKVLDFHYFQLQRLLLAELYYYKVVPALNENIRSVANFTYYYISSEFHYINIHQHKSVSV